MSNTIHVKPTHRSASPIQNIPRVMYAARCSPSPDFLKHRILIVIDETIASPNAMAIMPKTAVGLLMIFLPSPEHVNHSHANSMHPPVILYVADFLNDFLLPPCESRYNPYGPQNKSLKPIHTARSFSLLLAQLRVIFVSELLQTAHHPFLSRGSSST